MKTNKIFTLLVIALTFAISGWLIMDTVETGYESALPTTISIEQTEIDMGQLQQDKPQTATFKILNTGEKPLFIKHVESSCGCTEPKWPKKPVKPGRTAEVKVTYDAEHPGRFIKQIKVFCNTEKGVVELRIFGEVREQLAVGSIQSVNDETESTVNLCVTKAVTQRHAKNRRATQRKFKKLSVSLFSQRTSV